MKATEVMQVVVPVNREGELSEEGLESLADAIDDGWITFGGSVHVSPSKKYPQGSIIFVFKRCSSQRK